MKNNLLRMGYVMVSRALLQEICEKKGAACCEEEAFLRVLTNVNFKPAVVFCNGAGVQCARGESVITFMGWADIFGWTRARTRRFFDRCFAAGLIERVPGCCPSHIHVPGYDAWTGQPASIGKVMNAAGSFSAAAVPVAAKSKSSAAFEESLKEFLAYYGRTTHLPVENGSYVRALWKQLSTRERELAYRKVEDYYFSLNNTHFCYQAAKYLEYRIFENEFVN